MPPWRLALVTMLQFLEHLSDREAAEAVRSRIDWNYAFALELTDPGFDCSMLSEFRSRPAAGGQELRFLYRMLARFTERGLLKMRGRQRTDSTHVLAAVRTMNRLELVARPTPRPSAPTPRGTSVCGCACSPACGPSSTHVDARATP